MDEKIDLTKININEWSDFWIKMDLVETTIHSINYRFNTIIQTAKGRKDYTREPSTFKRLDIEEIKNLIAECQILRKKLNKISQKMPTFIAELQLAIE